MQTLLTVCSLLILIGCAWSFVRAQRAADAAEEHEEQARRHGLKLFEEKTRITTTERDLDALRRELRKLSGKFYARERRLDEALSFDDDEPQDGDAHQQLPMPLEAVSVCENWIAAQSQGPGSIAASCDCSYCKARREHRRQLRDQLVPKTVRGQAEVAKLNAGKP